MFRMGPSSPRFKRADEIGAEQSGTNRSGRLIRRGRVLTQSLSIILPVQDSQHQLRRHISDLLEVLPDLTNRFEILVIDYASTDQTEEVAFDLAREFPQLRVLRLRERQGREAAVASGLKLCKGDVIFVKEEAGPVRGSEVRRLWAMREDRDLIMAQAEPEPLNPNLIRRLVDWGAALEKHASQQKGGIQMIRRRAAEKLDPHSREIELSRKPHQPVYS